MTDFLFNWLPLVALVAAVLFGVVLMILGLRGMSKARKLRNSGVTTLACVTEKKARTSEYQASQSNVHDRHTSTIHYLSYAFTIDGKDYDATQAAPSDLWETVQEGSDVEIIYYPADPSVNQLAAAVLGTSGIGPGIQFGVGLVFGLGSFLIMGMFTLDALRGPDPVHPGATWVERYGVILWVRTPENPFMRIFAPDARRIYVEIGEMEPGKLFSGRETLIYPYQAKGIVLEPGLELRAFIDPDNEFYSVLEIEGTPR